MTKRNGDSTQALKKVAGLTPESVPAKPRSVNHLEQPYALNLTQRLRATTEALGFDAELVERYYGRMLNIHPSLLPNYPGLNTHARAIAGRAAEHGASVHFVTPELDAGPIVIQGRVPVLPSDTPESLAQRVHQEEYRIYPRAITWLAQGRLSIEADRVLLDERPVDVRG